MVSRMVPKKGGKREGDPPSYSGREILG